MKRSQAAVVRTCKFPRGSPEYFYSLLMLCMPHRLVGEIHITTAKDVFMEKVTNGEIDMEHLRYEHLVDEIETAVESLRMLENDTDHFDNDTDVSNEV